MSAKWSALSDHSDGLPLTLALPALGAFPAAPTVGAKIAPTSRAAAASDAASLAEGWIVLLRANPRIGEPPRSFLGPDGGPNRPCYCPAGIPRSRMSTAG